MSKRDDIHKILIIGSGPIVVGQACEFDYSGTQAVKALKEEGYEIVLLNPNPATTQTCNGLADHIYMEPLSTAYVEKILEQERPDALLTTMGGQTGLNLAVELSRQGILDRYGVRIIGASIRSINLAEDRERFKQVVASLGLESPKSVSVHTMAEAMEAKRRIGFPLIIRPSYTLGGFGGSMAEDDDAFAVNIARALEASPAHEALVEESLVGWKEFEMEVMRDRKDNAIVVCSIENIDPMGVHTGDSITIAPIQTLDDRAYQKMRDASIAILRAVGVDCGGSNVQFAVNPKDGRMVVIEMNPRVSRSSALASKATGFPIARCSAKLAVGYTLDEVLNEITGKTASCYEPALDYCAVKVPRFELEKFPMPYQALGTQMRSIGEALALGRTALEALNKAIRASERKLEGLEDLREAGYGDEETERFLRSAHPLRLLAAYSLLARGAMDIAAIHEATGFDPWFLAQLQRQADLDRALRSRGIEPDLLAKAKRAGMSDRRIAFLTGTDEAAAARARKAAGILAVSHHVDTCAGEFEARTPYCYTTYGEQDETRPLGKDAVIIIASGPNRIGQGLEFDTCCTLCSLALRKHGVRTIMVNSNPETVSTDHNISDRLYIEPLTAEHVKEIMRLEGTRNVIVQLGGQTPLNMADDLQEAGAAIVGTSLDGLDEAGDRERFGALVEKLGLRCPKHRTAHSVDEIKRKAHEVGFPVLLRPSFVLGGRGMFIVDGDDGLDDFIAHSGVEVSARKPVLIDQFLEDAFEYDLDAVSDGTNLYIGGIVQHIEAAGIHSGDSAAVFPPYKARTAVLEAMRDWALRLARALHVKGLMNIQFASKGDDLYLIEVNPRASRTVPFISKTSGVNLVEAAVRVWLGEDLVRQGLVPAGASVAEGRPMAGWAIKEAVFSFDRFSGVDPALGPEMRSTGEAIGMGRTFGEAYAKSQMAAGNVLPTKGSVVITVNDDDHRTIIPIARALEKLGFSLYATRGTARALFEAGILANVALKTQEGHPNIVDLMQAHRVQLVINTPKGFHARRSDDDIRTMAMRLHIPYTTTTSAASAAVEAIAYEQTGDYAVRELPRGRWDLR